MSRILFFAAGAAAGAYALRKYQRTVEPMTPKGWLKQAESAAREAGSFIKDARDAMREREAQIHGTIGTVDEPAPQPNLPTLTSGIHTHTSPVDVRETHNTAQQGADNAVADSGPKHVTQQATTVAPPATSTRRRQARSARRPNTNG